jgi:hypothetical protein
MCQYSIQINNVILTIREGGVTIKDNLKDYIDQRSQLHNVKLLDFFFLNTYETEMAPHLQATMDVLLVNRFLILNALYMAKVLCY